MVGSKLKYFAHVRRNICCGENDISLACVCVLILCGKRDVNLNISLEYSHESVHRQSLFDTN